MLYLPYYFCLMIEGSGTVYLTNGSGSGRPKNLRIRIRIRNTAGIALKIQGRYLGSLYDSKIVELSESRAHPAAYSRGAEQQAGRHHPLQLGEGGLLDQLRHLLPRLTILIPGQPIIHQPLQWMICSRL
jgi:hypothetical protein